MSTDARLPIPLKVYISAGARSELIETRNVRLNYNVPDNMFSLPNETKVTEKKSSG